DAGKQGHPAIQLRLRAASAEEVVVERLDKLLIGGQLRGRVANDNRAGAWRQGGAGERIVGEILDDLGRRGGAEKIILRINGAVGCLRVEQVDGEAVAGRGVAEPELAEVVAA